MKKFLSSPWLKATAYCFLFVFSFAVMLFQDNYALGVLCGFSLAVWLYHILDFCFELGKKSASKEVQHEEE